MEGIIARPTGSAYRPGFRGGFHGRRASASTSAQRNVAVTANTYTHVLSDEPELDDLELTR